MILNMPSKGKIYHYTNFGALVNILQSSSLWLSHSSCLNDLSEGRHGIQKIAEYLRKHPKDKRYFNFFKRNNLREAMDFAMKKEGFYVISFCQNGDLLSQWRAYGGDGSGVALGINSGIGD